ncbi:hypothetical protein K523DRAFT_414444 [Schizophyllum commune Tattone D]|nr:hypothetical protein K523DRAFT_414444 [Schizophyllum commune Tattone D]
MAVTHSIVLAASMIELFSYGLYTTVYLQHVAAVYRRSAVRHKHVGTSLYIASFMYFLSSLHTAMTIYRAIQGFSFIHDRDEQVAFFTSYAHWHFRVIFAAEMAQVIMADLVLLQLTYVVWGNQWWSLVGPLTLFVISVVTGILAIVHLGIQPNVYMAVCLPSSLAENLLITALLAWRLRQRHRKSMRAGLVSVGDEAFDRPYERPVDRPAAGGIGAEDRQRPSVELSTVAGLPLNAGHLTSRRLASGSGSERGDASLNSAHRLAGSISSSHGSAAHRGRLLRISRTIVRTSAIWHVLFGLFTALSLAESVAQTLTQAAIPATAGLTYSLLTLRLYRLLDDDHAQIAQWQLPTIQIRAAAAQRRSSEDRRSESSFKG